MIYSATIFCLTLPRPECPQPSQSRLVLQERSRPAQPPRKPEAAPFFLPTVAGLGGNPTFDVAAPAPAPGDALSGKKRKKKGATADGIAAAPAGGPAAEPTAAQGWGGGDDDAGEGEEDQEAGAPGSGRGGAASGSGVRSIALTIQRVNAASGWLAPAVLLQATAADHLFSARHTSLGSIIARGACACCAALVKQNEDDPWTTLGLLTLYTASFRKSNILRRAQ